MSNDHILLFSQVNDAPSTAQITLRPVASWLWMMNWERCSSDLFKILILDLKGEYLLKKTIHNGKKQGYFIQYID
jgi:hypothetical protein